MTSFCLILYFRCFYRISKSEKKQSACAKKMAERGASRKIAVAFLVRVLNCIHLLAHATAFSASFSISQKYLPEKQTQHHNIRALLPFLPFLPRALCKSETKNNYAKPTQQASKAIQPTNVFQRYTGEKRIVTVTYFAVGLPALLPLYKQQKNFLIAQLQIFSPTTFAQRPLRLTTANYRYITYTLSIPCRSWYFKNRSDGT